MPDRETLRQGDILEGLYYPKMECENLILLGQPADAIAATGDRFNLLPVTKTESALKWFTAVIQVSRSYMVVLSQCCDLQRRNGKLSVRTFVVAPLIPVPHQISIDADRLDRLKINSLNEFLNFFYIGQYSPLPQDYVVDFGMPVPIPGSEYVFSLSRKILQMDDQIRVRFKMKLSSHFARPTQEEMDAGLYPTC